MSADPAFSTPKAAATDWFMRQRGGAMTPNETRAFEVWMARDPENQAAFHRVERTWALAGDLDDDPAILDAQHRAESRLTVRAQTHAVGIAAAALVIVGGVGFGLARTGVLAEFGLFRPPPAQEFRTAVGQQISVALTDGSIVRLDTDTVMHAQMSGHIRRITLERGQASFKVAKDRSRPFIVAAAGMSVRATGTEFDVRVDPTRFQVTLIEGRVRVQEQGREREDAPMANMRPGWRLAVGEDQRWRMEPVNLLRETSWHDGILTFHEDPLEIAVAEMNRYSARKIVFLGSPSQKLVMGNFHTGDVDGFVRAVELNKLARVASSTEEKVELTTAR